MSFRNRLTLFFVLIVVVPMVAVAFVLFRLIADNESGKADARLAAANSSAINLYHEDYNRAQAAAARIGRRRVLAAGACARTTARAPAGARGRPGSSRRAVRRIVLARGDQAIADAGSRTAVFPAAPQPRGTRQPAVRHAAGVGAGAGDLHGPALAPDRLRGPVVQRVGGPVLASSVKGVDPASIPADHGELESRTRATTPRRSRSPGFVGETTGRRPRAQGAESTAVRNGRLLAAGILAGFFVLAFTFAPAGLALAAAPDRRLPAGRPAAWARATSRSRSPTEGHDEFAALGEEFNKMSRQLEERLEELNQERARLQDAMRRIGETFAANLDRRACWRSWSGPRSTAWGADAGRASVRPNASAPLEQVALTGRSTGSRRRARGRGEGARDRRAVRGDRRRRRGALAPDAPRRRRPRARLGCRLGGAPRPAVHVAERELFHYLAEQAAVSIENVGLHETVERQAVTDELTGLFNRRRFQEAMATEVERSKRFGQPVGLVLLDLDDFKTVNDTYGHQQGDLVLREVARVLRETSREIDEPARYGGEELAVVLPGTDLEGAYNLAERVRAGIEELALPLLDGDGDAARDRELRRGDPARVGRRHARARGRGRRGALPGQAGRQEPHRAG
jgi:diguanylate cyclase (GGDEF)-like protein